MSPSLRQIRAGPRQQHCNSNVRQISEAICPGLETDLNNTKDRNEQKQIPEPSDEHVRMFLLNQNREKRDRDNQHYGRYDDPNVSLIVRMRIENGEVGRPEHLPDISEHNDRGGLESRHERRLLDGKSVW